MSNASTSRSRTTKKKSPRVQYNTKDSNKVVDVLSSHAVPQKTLALARACGYNTSKSINPTLYELQRKGKIIQVQSQPPTWSLAAESDEVTTSLPMSLNGCGRGVLGIVCNEDVKPEQPGGKGRNKKAKRGGQRGKGKGGASGTFRNDINESQGHNSFGRGRGAPTLRADHSHGFSKAHQSLFDQMDNINLNHSNIKTNFSGFSMANENVFRFGSDSNSKNNKTIGYHNSVNMRGNFKKISGGRSTANRPIVSRPQIFTGQHNGVEANYFDDFSITEQNAVPPGAYSGKGAALDRSSIYENLKNNQSYCPERNQTFPSMQQQQPRPMQISNHVYMFRNTSADSSAPGAYKPSQTETKRDSLIPPETSKNCDNTSEGRQSLPFFSSQSKPQISTNSGYLPVGHESSELRHEMDLYAQCGNNYDILEETTINNSQQQKNENYNGVFSDIDSEDEESNLSLRVRDMCDIEDFSDLNLIKDEEEEEIEEDWVGPTMIDTESECASCLEQNLVNDHIDEGIANDVKSMPFFNYLNGHFQIGDSSDIELRVLAALLTSPGYKIRENNLIDRLRTNEEHLQDILAECVQEDFLQFNSEDKTLVLKSNGLVRLHKSCLDKSSTMKSVGGPPLNPHQLMNASQDFSNLRMTPTSGLGRGHALFEVIRRRSMNGPGNKMNPYKLEGSTAPGSREYQTNKDFDMRRSALSEFSTKPSAFTRVETKPESIKSQDTDLGSEYLVYVDRDSIPQRQPLLTTPLSNVDGPKLNPSGFLNRDGQRAPLLPNPSQLQKVGSYSMNPMTSSHPVSQSSHELQINSESFAAINKNPISALMEYAQSRRLPAAINVISQSGPPHKPRFVVAAVVGSRQFPGITHSNKKDGRRDAAEQAIRTLIAEGQYHLPSQVSVSRVPDSQMTLFDKMAALTHNKFNSLMTTIPETLTGRKVIAGLIMKIDDMDTGTVVSIGSGNRCVTGDKLSLYGHTVNDCHAEVITRRGFMRFLYAQLQHYHHGEDHPIFEPSKSGKLKVKDTVTFHLYISTAPCGDGALFSPRDVKANSGPVSEHYVKHQPTMGNAAQGVLRTKMEGGEGTIPIQTSDQTPQTWDGILRGERLRTMSCSDKLCRWNIVGMQGALISHFLDPIYMHSLTLGYLYDHGHLSRAVCCRLDQGSPSLEEELPHTYRLNHPLLGRVTACDPPRETQKTKSFSVNWTVGDVRPEVLEGCTGRPSPGEANCTESRISKFALYNQFKSTCHHLNKISLTNNPNYLQAKRRSADFLHAKLAMCEKLETLGLGRWVSKPEEEKLFSWDLFTTSEIEGFGKTESAMQENEGLGKKEIDVQEIEGLGKTENDLQEIEGLGNIDNDPQEIEGLGKIENDPQEIEGFGTTENDTNVDKETSVKEKKVLKLENSVENILKANLIDDINSFKPISNETSVMAQPGEESSSGFHSEVEVLSLQKESVCQSSKLLAENICERLQIIENIKLLEQQLLVLKYDKIKSDLSRNTKSQDDTLRTNSDVGLDIG